MIRRRVERVSAMARSSSTVCGRISILSPDAKAAKGPPSCGTMRGGFRSSPAANHGQSPGQSGGEAPMNVQEMLNTHPAKGEIPAALIRCIEECYACAQSCTACADACLAEEMVADLRQCIHLNLDCADICIAAGAIASRRTGSDRRTLRAVLEACATACHGCAEECARHADRHEHCRICAEQCRACADACEKALAELH